MFVTTHYMDEAEHCHTIALLHQGRLVACGTPGHLRSQSVEGELLEVDCGSPALALEVLALVPDLSQVALYGTRLHVVVRQGLEARERVAALLQQNGIRVRRLERVEPSLEDAFISLVGREPRAGLDTSSGTSP